MRLLLLSALLIFSGAAFAQVKTEKRLTGLEKRMTKVEKRLTDIEVGAARPGARPAAAAPRKEPENPIAVSFMGKKQVTGQTRLGMKLYLEFENLSSRSFFAFNGTLVFRNEAGALIWSRPYAHSEPLGAGQKVDVSMGILSTQAKEYLRFVKARSVTVSLEKQQAYAAD
ncbi:MAG: hypothetical protein Q7R35_15835 [Elusimicrobiota bacterium]|nr:hypothetical protein [Elusimicrobiota bacterium]